jgi:sulfotransferase
LVQIFFNSSLPRSGSTLRQNVLAQNPSIRCTVTSPVSHLLTGARGVFQTDPYVNGHTSWQETENNWLGFCKGALEGYYSRVKEPYVIDKSRNWLLYYEWLEAFYAQPKVLCMVRDPSAILASLEKLHRSKRFRGDANTDQILTVDQRAAYFMSNAPLGPAMLAIKSAIDNGFDKKILFIKFEDFCSDFTNEINRIYDYLEVRRFRHSKVVGQLVPEHDGVYGIFGDHQVHRGEIKAPTDSPRKIIGDGPANMIADSNIWFYDKFKYPMRP